MTRGFLFALAALGSTAMVAAACGSSDKSSSGFTMSSSGHGGSTTSSGHGGASSSSGSGHGGDGGAGGGGFLLDSGPSDASLDSDACGAVTLQQMITPGNIVVVFDQSDSMNDAYAPDGGSGTTNKKWYVAQQAIIAALTPNEHLLNGGSIFFPTAPEDDAGCADTAIVAPITKAPQIAIETGTKFVTDFSDHFTAKGWSLILGTPTVLALKQADAALNPGPKVGQSAVVLITDGAPTCDTKQADLVAPVSDMLSRGIKTYAIGLPGSASASSLLNAIAAAGGTGTFIAPGDSATLQAALAQIASDTLSQCTITLNPPPTDPNLVNLVVTTTGQPNGFDVPQGDGGNGWTLSADGTTVTLEGSVCTTAKTGGYTSIQFVYGCPTFN